MGSSTHKPADERPRIDLSTQFPVRLSWIPATALQFGASALAVLSLMPVLAGPCARLMPVALREWYGYSGTFGTSFIRKALSHRALVFFGEISFAIYLVHFPIAHIIALRCGKFIGRNCMSPQAANSHQLMICPFVPANRAVESKAEAE